MIKRKNTPEYRKVFESMGLSGEFWDIFASCNEQMEWLEDEIHTAIMADSDHAAALWTSFMACNSQYLADCPSGDIWRAHYREILTRARSHVKIHEWRNGTKAEVLWLICKTSLWGGAPLTRKGSMLYTRLFYELLPDHRHILDPEDEFDLFRNIARESHDGEYNIALAMARKRCMTHDRQERDRTRMPEWVAEKYRDEHGIAITYYPPASEQLSLAI